MIFDLVRKNVARKCELGAQENRFPSKGRHLYSHRHTKRHFAVFSLNPPTHPPLFLIGITFINSHASQDSRRKWGRGWGAFLTLFYQFHPLHRHLDISRAVISSRTKCKPDWPLSHSFKCWTHVECQILNTRSLWEIQTPSWSRIHQKKSAFPY